MFFSQDWRERIKVENPDAGFGKCPFWECLFAWQSVDTDQARSVSCLEQSGRSSTKRRRRYVKALSTCIELILIAGCSRTRTSLLMTGPVLSKRRPSTTYVLYSFIFALTLTPGQ